ncbi:MAG: hypothetical protein MHM6MM_006284 [Cercozoa sp. M6MM]
MVLFHVDHIEVRKSDILRLRENQWFNDTIVAAFLSILRRLHTAPSQVFMWDSVSFASLSSKLQSEVVCAECAENYENKDDPSAVIARTRGVVDAPTLRYFARYCRKSGNPWHADTIVIPLSGGGHWSLVVVHDRHIMHFDSLGNKGHSRQDAVQRVRAVLHVLHSISLEERPAPNKIDPSQLIPHTPPIPQQVNSSDCGVFVCLIARDFFLQRPVNVDALRGNVRRKVRLIFRNYLIAHRTDKGCREALRLLNAMDPQRPPRTKPTQERALKRRRIVPVTKRPVQPVPTRRTALRNRMPSFQPIFPDRRNLLPSIAVPPRILVPSRTLPSGITRDNEHPRTRGEPSDSDSDNDNAVGLTSDADRHEVPRAAGFASSLTDLWRRAVQLFFPG